MHRIEVEQIADHVWFTAPPPKERDPNARSIIC
jgi:hypothetical protein